MKSNTTLLCVNGTGSECNSWDAETQDIFNKTADFWPNGNCGSRVFAHGTGS